MNQVIRIENTTNGHLSCLRKAGVTKGIHGKLGALIHRLNLDPQKSKIDYGKIAGTV